MIIVTASDDNFAIGLFGLIHSASHHNPQARFYVLDVGIGDTWRARLEEFCRARDIVCDIVRIESSLFSKCPIRKHLSLATYARLLLPDILPGDDKAIYLDADTLVVSGLQDIWDMELGDDLVAGVADGFIVRKEFEAHPALRPETYINAGVIVINLARWREEGVGEKLMSWIEMNQDALYHDQTAINVNLNGRIRILPRNLNLLAQEYIGIKWQTPRIIHYVGIYKPWHYKLTPLCKVYDAHRIASRSGVEAPSIISRRVRRDIHKWLIGLLCLRPKYWRAVSTFLYYKLTFTDPYVRRLRADVAPPPEMPEETQGVSSRVA